MKIYTRRGDQGDTSLLGGERVPKTDPRVRAYGTVDELNAAVGLALALARDASGGPSPVPEDSRVLDRDRLGRVQDDLFTLGARLAAADPERSREKGLVRPLPPDRVQELERWIDEVQEQLPELDAFILPGGHPVGAQLHVARTVCRRAERAAVGLAEDQPELGEALLPYLNRLSDLLFVLARAVNHAVGETEEEWTPGRRRGEEAPLPDPDGVEDPGTAGPESGKAGGPDEQP